tara:strand:+ start:401 stop:1033 length:633 start_codon:yes stop_codon:yes gene_type:complete
MENKIQQIIGTLTEGISEQSVEEVCALVDEVVEERVQEEVNLLESKVSSFLRLKLDEMRQVAKQEFEANDENARALKIYEAVKTLVATDIDHEDMNSALGEYETKISELEESVGSLNESLNIAAQENVLLEGKVRTLEESNAELEEGVAHLQEQRENLEEAASLPFKSSESAVVITNDPDRKVLSEQASDNRFLSEDVIRLSQLINEGRK